LPPYRARPNIAVTKGNLSLDAVRFLPSSMLFPEG
jgi:hypothetical protein